MITTLAPDVLARLSDPALDARIADADSNPPEGRGVENALQGDSERKALTEAAEELDARIGVALSDGAKSDDVRRVLADVEAAAKEAEAAAAEARERALDPLVDDAIVARGAMDDAAFKRDRLVEAAKRLGKRVDELKALEADRRMWAEHERVLAERDRLAEEMEGMVSQIVKIAHLVVEIEAVDRLVGRLNATAALQHGHIAPVLIGSPQAVQVLFADALIWDGFASVAALQALPVASGDASAKDKLRVKRSASSPATP